MSTVVAVCIGDPLSGPVQQHYTLARFPTKRQISHSRLFARRKCPETLKNQTCDGEFSATSSTPAAMTSPTACVLAL